MVRQIRSPRLILLRLLLRPAQFCSALRAASLKFGPCTKRISTSAPIAAAAALHILRTHRLPLDTAEHSRVLTFGFTMQMC